MSNEHDLQAHIFVAYLSYIVPIGFGECLGVVSRPIHEGIVIPNQQHRWDEFHRVLHREAHILPRGQRSLLVFRRLGLPDVRSYVGSRPADPVPEYIRCGRAEGKCS